MKFVSLWIQEGFVHNAASQRVPLGGPDKQEAIAKAETAWQLYKEIEEDCWVISHIKSFVDDQKQMEGTRLTLVGSCIGNSCMNLRWSFIVC